jgi:hypothetical protein
VIGVASLLGLPAMYGWSSLWLQTSAPSLLWGPVSFLLIFVTVAGALVLYAFVRDRASHGARLDERQRALRDRAWIFCYEILAAVIVIAVAVLAVVVLIVGRDVTLDGAFVSGLAICIGVLIPLLPVAALAWVEPDPPAEA